jgi:hypothetical protein
MVNVGSDDCEVGTGSRNFFGEMNYDRLAVNVASDSQRQESSWERGQIPLRTRFTTTLRQAG